MRTVPLLLALTAVAASPAARADKRSRPSRVASADDRVELERGQQISLVDLLEAAVQRSPGLTIARADREDAIHRAAFAEAIDQWHIVGRVSAASTTVDRQLAGPSVAIDSRTTDAAVGVARDLPTGGALTVTVGTGSVHNVYPAAARAETPDDVIRQGSTATATAQVTHSLLRGLGVDVARAGKHTDQLAAKALSAQAKDEAAGLVRDIVIGYWELAYLSEALAVDRDAEELARKQVAITQDVVRAGLQPPSAVKIAELQVALRQEALLRDQIALGDQSLAIRRLAGLELAGAPLVPTDALAIPRTEWNEDDAVSATLAHGPQMQETKLAARAADITVDVTKNAMLPRLDLTLSGSVSSVGPSAGDAIGNLGGAQAYSVMGGLALQWDIGGAATAAAASARVHRARLDAQRADLEHQLAAAAMSAVRQLHAAKQRVKISELAVQVADEALRAEVVAFQAGRSTNVLVFQRQDDAAQAKLRLARARVDAVEAIAILDYLTGELLSRYGVSLADVAETGRQP